MKISGVRAIYAAIVLCGAVYAFVALRGPNGIPGLIEKRHQVEVLEHDNQILHRQLEEKQQRIERLQANPSEQEFEIRQRLKLARPGEKIFILDDKNNTKK